MWKYAIKRIGYMFIALFFIITITFFLMRSIPGDPLAFMAQTLPEQTKANFYAKYGLDKPLMAQYGAYMRNIVTNLDLGDSLVYPGRNVAGTIAETSPISGSIGGIALLIGLIMGISSGIFAALYKNKLPDYVVMFISILGVTVPVYVLGSLLQYFLAIKLGAFPTSGWGDKKHMVIPIICLCFGPMASYARYIKSSMLDTLSQDYITTAYAKGLTGFQVVTRHALRNSLLPAITILGSRIVGIFTGSFVIERMFSIPGIGLYYINSINLNDFSMVLGLTIFYAALFVVMQLVVDFVYILVDPRIRLSQEKL